MWLVQVFPLALMLDPEYSPLEGASACRRSPPRVRVGQGVLPSACCPLGQPAETCHRHDHYQPPRWWLHLTVIVVLHLPLLDYFYISFFLYKERELVAHPGLNVESDVLSFALRFSVIPAALYHSIVDLIVTFWYVPKQGRKVIVA